MENVKWLRREFVPAAHNAQLVQHGETSGIRDEGLLESALARPQNLSAYEEDAGVQRLAAAYLFGLTHNHPFEDGNKRVAYAAAEVFLLLNGFAVTAHQVEKYEMVMRLASGELSEEGPARWFAEHTAPADAPQA